MVFGITGASGSPIAAMLLQRLRELEYSSKTALIFTENGKRVWEYENEGIEDILKDFATFQNDNMFVPFASGHSDYNAMIICPCSMGTLGRIASGVSHDLIGRTADVMLKERRPLVIVIREAPYNMIHLKNMQKLHRAGAIILPASPGFYHKPKNIPDLFRPLVDRILHHAGIENLSGAWTD